MFNYSTPPAIDNNTLLRERTPITLNGRAMFYRVSSKGSPRSSFETVCGLVNKLSIAKDYSSKLLPQLLH